MESTEPAKTRRRLQLPPRPFSFFIAIFAFLLGFGLILYPYVSDLAHKINQQRVSEQQSEVVSKTDTSDLDAEYRRAVEYNERLRKSKTVVTDPFDPNAQVMTPQEYQARLNLNRDGVMATIIIPKLNVSVPIYHGTEDEELQKGVGHLQASSLPVGGESTHAVLAGHNGLPAMKVFDDIHELKAGDYFIIQVLGRTLAYEVTGTDTVLPDETDSLEIQDGKDLVTLVTCTPYGINTHRLLVHAKRIAVPQDWKDRVAAHGADGGVNPVAGDLPIVPFTLLGLAIAFAVGLTWVLRRRARPA